MENDEPEKTQSSTSIKEALLKKLHKLAAEQEEADERIAKYSSG